MQVEDAAGNTASTSQEFTIDDKTPPTVSLEEPEVEENRVTLSWAGSDNFSSEDMLEYQFRLVKYEDWTSWNGTTSQSYVDLEPGDYTFEVKVRDEAGNVSSSKIEFKLGDIIKPEVTINPPRFSYWWGTVVYLSWEGTDIETKTSKLEYRYQLDGTGWSEWSKRDTWERRINSKQHTFEVEVIDEAGNVGYSSIIFTIGDDGDDRDD